ncbi:MAG: DegV family protein [Lachnospiraceae bacterium]|nr:DegV family protein [Lachnospiraceae bacterium]
MNGFKMVTDTSADLPASYLKENNIEVLSLAYTIDGDTYTWENPMDEHEFYTRMRKGSMPTTSQVNIGDAEKVFEKLIETEDEILCISFSSGLSGTYNSTAVAAQNVCEAHPDKKIRVVDSKAASLGQGLMVDFALRMQKEGKSMDETADYLEQNLKHFVHVFTVDDLNHLYRGGRVSRATAFVGTLANIKPILHVDDEGHLINIGKVRGRKKALIELVNLMEQKIGDHIGENKKVFISHGDSPEDAEFVADEVKKRFGIDSFLMNYVGPTIGAHSGPGTIALFFFGNER